MKKKMMEAPFFREEETGFFAHKARLRDQAEKQKTCKKMVGSMGATVKIKQEKTRGSRRGGFNASHE